MSEVLVTGGSGFFGGILKRELLGRGFAVTNLDVVPDPDRHDCLTSIQGDIREESLLDSLFANKRFDAVFHCAAMLAHGYTDEKLLWSANVEGTRSLARACRRYGVGKFVFTSTNCLWGRNLGHPVREDEPPAPVEVYGRSKLAAEEVLAEYTQDFDVVVLRCPTVIGGGRLGLREPISVHLFRGPGERVYRGAPN
jgi:nucleoside-diphosphate-sugar epimerase